MRRKHYPPLNKSEKLYTVRDFIEKDALRFEDNPAFLIEPDHRQKYISFRQYRNDTEALGSWILEQGFCEQKIGVIGENSYAWILAYTAVLCSGNIAVPIDCALDQTEIHRILERSDCVAVFCSKSVSSLIDWPGDRKLFMLEHVPDLLAKGYTLIREKKSVFESVEITKETPAAIVYTSGTTGEAKGVMLSHFNIASDVEASMRHVEASGLTFSLLPLHHTFSSTVATYTVLHNGAYIFMDSKLRRLEKDAKRLNPTFLEFVPMIAEGIHKRIWQKVREEGKERQLRFLMNVSNLLLRVGIDRRKQFFGRVTGALGDNIAWISCGGAALSEDVARDYHAWGIEIYSGYGITECSPCIATNRRGCNKFGSAGTVISCCEVKIKEPDANGEGEILVRGDNVMIGYYKDPEATKEAFEGVWFKTGDVGYLDADGFLFVTGRVKNLIVLSNGKNVSPEELEGTIGHIDGIQEVLVFGEGDRIVAEIFPQEEASHDAIEKRIFEFNKTQPQFKQIAEIRFRETEFEKTTTKKIKRP